MNLEKLSKLQTILQEMTDTGFVSGASCMVLQNGRELCYYESGYRDSAKRLSVTRDTLFRLYSMTKPVTSAAVMMLVEEGRLDLLEPVCRFLPSFKNQCVLQNGMPAHITRLMTVKDLLNMTSGLVYPGESNAAETRTAALMEEIIAKMDSDHALTTLEIMERLGQIPLAFEPGSKWQYGLSADVLGAVIEVVSGMRFGEFLSKRIFEPLGMKDTGFYVPEEKQGRLARIYRDADGALEEYAFPHLGISNHMKRPPAFESGGAGLVSTIDDYAAFTQMLLQKGTYNGAELLSPKTVEFMTSARLSPSLQSYIDQWESLPGYTYANLMRIMIDPGAASYMGSPGEYGWDGWLGPYMVNAPADNLTFLFMQQKTDSGTTPYTRKLRNVVFSAR